MFFHPMLRRRAPAVAAGALAAGALAGVFAAPADAAVTAAPPAVTAAVRAAASTLTAPPAASVTAIPASASVTGVPALAPHPVKRDSASTYFGAGCSASVTQDNNAGNWSRINMDNRSCGTSRIVIHASDHRVLFDSGWWPPGVRSWGGGCCSQNGYVTYSTAWGLKADWF